jgi:hypothetical protein
MTRALDYHYVLLWFISYELATLLRQKEKEKSPGIKKSRVVNSTSAHLLGIESRTEQEFS